MDALLDKKTELLSLYYPGYATDVLRDILVSCDGNVDRARALIQDPALENPGKQRSFAQVQTTLTGFKRSSRSDTKSYLVSSKKPKLGVPSLPQALARSPQITLNTPEDVEHHLKGYALLHLNFFPKDVADGLLSELAASKEKFRTRQFYLFGNLCTLNLKVALFAARDADYPSLVYNGLQIAGDNGPHEYSPRFEMAAKYLEEKMNNTFIPQNPKLPLQLSDKWTAGFCVANMYEKLDNHLDWHSDRLSHIGPHNYIASVLLGLTRLFKLRSTHKNGAPVFLVPLPHNSLFLMKPGCQEEFKHTLAPMSKLLLLHPEVGLLRIGLTFRNYLSDFIRNLPKCRCDLPMMLRRAFKSPETRGKYFWLCENVYQNKDCGAFHWADINNWKDHFIADSQEKASRWIAPE